MLSDTMMLGGGRTAAYSIKNSLLFRGAQYLSRTPAAPGDLQKWTLSVWVKRASLTSQQIIFASGGVDINRDWLAFGAGAADYLTFKLNEGSDCTLDTQALSRDVSGTYHIVVAADYAQETASNRVKLYVNGVRVTSFSSENYPEQHYLGKVNGVYAHAIGRLDGGSYFNGYLAAPVLIDGAALPASSFGEFDKISGSWRPKGIAGLDFGPNGFYLGKPWDSADLGKDASGRGNHWTPSGFDAADVVLDSPTNVYATLNPLANFYGSSVSAGNLSFSGPSSAMLNSTLAIPKSGKWWFEVKCSTIGNAASIGISTDALASHSRFYRSDTGEKVVDGVITPYGASWGTANTMNIAVDMDAGTLALYKDGVSQGVLASDLVSSGYTWFLFVTSNAAAHAGSVNFGQRAFTHAPPAGYKSLCTANLPAPSAAARQPWKYYSCRTVVHDGTSSTFTLGWNPDPANGGSHTLFRVKGLAAGNSWLWADTVRGLSKILNSDSAGSESTDATRIVSAASTGVVTLGSGFSAGTFLVEAWRVAPEAGFDIVAFTSPASGTFSIGHNNGSVPKLVIAKSRSTASTHWVTYHAEVPGKFLLLDTTEAAAADVAYFNGAPTVTTINLGAAANFPADSVYVAYVWSEVPGFSKFGSDIGNGSYDGPFVSQGFSAGAILRKRVDASSNWYCHAQPLAAGNPVYPLRLNASEAVSAGTYPADLLSNGVKVRSNDSEMNASGGTYVTAAWAAHPLGGRRVSPATAR